MKYLGIFAYVLVILLFGLFATSCKEENLKPGVPAFIQIDTCTFTSYYGSQGTARQKITDVWVFADGATIGVFELPATIPILKDGLGELRLEPGIEINGISTTRINNPFFEPLVFEEYIFIPDSVSTIPLASTYRESSIFVWLENFEDPSISLDTSNLFSTVAVERIGGGQAFEGSYSGIITLDSTHTIFEAATFNSFELPKTGSPVLLEMNYKNDYYFTMGIIEETTSQVLKSDILVVNPSDEWNKIYVNYTDYVRASSATSFKVLIRTFLQGDATEATIMLDNMKLIYR